MGEFREDSVDRRDYNLTVRMAGNVGEVSYSDYVPTNGLEDLQLPLARFVQNSFESLDKCWKDDPPKAGEGGEN